MALAQELARGARRGVCVTLGGVVSGFPSVMTSSPQLDNVSNLLYSTSLEAKQRHVFRVGEKTCELGGMLGSSLPGGP
jgi:hypothetical protein